jgi:hypothetical protein
LSYNCAIVAFNDNKGANHLNLARQQSARAVWGNLTHSGLMCGLVVLCDIAEWRKLLWFIKNAGCKQRASWGAAKVPMHNKTSVMQILLSALILSATISSSTKLEIRKADTCQNGCRATNPAMVCHHIMKSGAGESKQPNRTICASTAQSQFSTHAHTHI